MPHISIRVTAEEKEQYKQTAQKDGRDLTKIIKTYLSRLNRYLDNKDES